MSLPSLILLLALPAAAQSQTPPPLGRLVDIGGYRVHIYCVGEGQGSPTVVIVGSGFSFDWGLVQPEAARRTKVCSYDVSGTAWSDPGPSMTCPARASEIHKLLVSAKIDGPYVLVGLSVGALVARLYASLYPSEVAGMVMVDHAFIDVGDPPAADPSSSSFAGLDSPPVLIHQTPIILTVEDTSDFRKLPESIQKLHRWAESLQPALPTVETARDCLQQLKGAAHALADTPLVVVSTGNELPNYKKLQRELLSLSTRSQQLMADRSFHSVEIDQPEVVVQAINQVVDMVARH